MRLFLQNKDSFFLSKMDPVLSANMLTADKRDYMAIW